MYVGMNDKTCIDCIYGRYMPKFHLVECGIYDDVMCEGDVCAFWSDNDDKD